MEEEPANDYCINGGYLRVNVGDTLGPEGRYVVKRKLGYVSPLLTGMVNMDGSSHSWACQPPLLAAPPALSQLHFVPNCMLTTSFPSSWGGFSTVWLALDSRSDFSSIQSTS
jgi:hypothetical protein